MPFARVEKGVNGDCSFKILGWSLTKTSLGFRV
jgi:hypothetical protein